MRARGMAVLVTDADRGIGRATALALGESGFWVLACGRDVAAMEDLPRETMPGGQVEIAPLDMGDPESCRAVLERMVEHYDQIDGVVLAGGRVGFAPVEEHPEADVRSLFEENFFGPLRLLREAAPRLRSAGRGRIVCVSNAAGRVSLPMTGAFSASRQALEGLCDALRMELSVFGVEVVLVEPGLIRNRIATGEVTARDFFHLRDASPYEPIARALTSAWHELHKKAATPEDVAKVVQRALVLPRPRPRYAVQRGTAALLLARKLLPERLLDSRLARAMGLDEIT